MLISVLPYILFVFCCVKSRPVLHNYYTKELPVCLSPTPLCSSPLAYIDCLLTKQYGPQKPAHTHCTWDKGSW